MIPVQETNLWDSRAPGTSVPSKHFTPANPLSGAVLGPHMKMMGPSQQMRKEKSRERKPNVIKLKRNEVRGRDKEQGKELKTKDS